MLQSVTFGAQLATSSAAAGATAAAVANGGLNPAADLAAVGSLTKAFSSLLGGGVTDTDRARLARAKSYYAGAAAGSVLSVQLALGAQQSNTAHEEQVLYAQTMQQIQATVPQVYAAAAARGLLHDAEDGRQGLAELLRLGVRFAEPGAGHPTGYNKYNNTDAATMQLVAQLAALPLTPTGNPDVAPPLPAVPGQHPALSSAAIAPPGSSLPWVLLLVFGGALFWIARKR